MGLRRPVVGALAFAVAAAVCGVPGAAAGDGQVNLIRGTEGRDKLIGTSGRDVIRAYQGNDSISPRGGADRVRAGRGDDVIHLRRDGKVDRIFCGPGFDVVAWSFETEARDIIDDSCEGQIA